MSTQVEKTRRGILIVIEGLDRSGKSTQCKLLSETLNSTELWKYPNRDTSIGKLIDDYLCKKIELEDHAVHLLFSANRWESVELMKKKLNSGVNLVIDRYAYSGVAYTSAKTGLDFEWCKQCDAGLPKPDLIFFMNTQSMELKDRSGFGNERYETSEFQSLVYKNFKKILNLESEENQNFLVVLNARDSIESLHKIILEKVMEAIKSSKLVENEFKYLW